MRRLFAGAAVSVLLVIASLAVAAAAAAVGGATGGFTKPLQGAVITQGFGCTSFVFEVMDPHCPGGHWHSGVDLAAPAGTPVRAIAPGHVTVLDSATGYGLHIVIDHGNGLSSLYGHLSSVTVLSGDTVAAGDVIGAVGSTGNSTGPHLHFEIRRDGIPEDPRDDMQLP